MVATIAISVTLLSSKTTFRNATIKPFSLKVTKEYRVAEKIRELVDPNSIVVCPISVTSWLTTLHKQPYPLVARNIYIAQQVHYLGRAEVRERIALNNYIVGNKSGGKASQKFRELLEKYNVQVICVANDNKRKRRIENRISQAGYKFVAKKAKHKIWLKTGT